MDQRQISFTAASTLPLKVIKNDFVQAGVKLGRLYPIHAQFIPTERCNLNCAWCSCANDSRRITMPIGQVERVVEILHRWSCRAATITGGGEPLMHPQIDSIFSLFHGAGIDIGLVTNAHLFKSRLSPESLQMATWCRISCSDDRGLETRGLGEQIEWAIDAAPDVDWAFSYVLTKKFNPERMAEYIHFANEYNFTHVRVVSDLFDLEGCPPMEEVQRAMAQRRVDDSLVIYQGRKEYTHGTRQCLISLLKPVIGADGRIFPCCGAQYALKEAPRHMPDELCMGTIDTLDDTYVHQRHFDGSVCYRCYYSAYNDLLAALLQTTEHLMFV